MIVRVAVSNLARPCTKLSTAAIVRLFILMVMSLVNRSLQPILTEVASLKEKKSAIAVGPKLVLPLINWDIFL